MKSKAVSGIMLTLLIVSLFGLSFISPVQATKITDIYWNSESKVIGITFDIFPSWGGWRMYLDGREISMEGGEGNPVIRPNAPVDEATGLFVGTLPWLSPLTEVDFPCCGTIQFDIPGEGLTNLYEFNLIDYGCQTASTKECPHDPSVVNHYGDLVIGGNETRLIEDLKYFQHGNIYVNDEARLIIRNSQLTMRHGDVPTVHIYTFVEPNAFLEIENSTVRPDGGLVVVGANGKVDIKDSPTEIHLLEIHADASITITNSEVINPIGGLVQIHGGDTKIINSTIGAIGLSIPANSALNVDGLKSGVYLESWNIHEDLNATNIPYNVVLENTYILEDTLKPGPYERGWIFFLDPDAHVRISDSELRKVFIDVINEDVRFENLRIGIPSGFKYRDIELENITLLGQWPFAVIDSNITMNNSNYLFMQPSGRSIVSLNNSHMVEFIPRDFFGTMIFENSSWTEAGEIIGDIPYHSMENNFTIKGSLRIEGVRENLKWHNASVRRIYDVFILDVDSQPIKGVSMIIDGKGFLTDDSGKAELTLIFNETNYLKPRELEVMEGDKIIAKCKIDFFTETPVIIIRARANMFDVVWDDVNYPVTVFSNSTVSQFVFDQSLAQISFKVSGETGTVGYCNVTIPKALLIGNPWIIKIDTTPITEFIQSDNGTHSFLYFTYTHQSTFVTIQGTWVIPEFPSAIILALFMILSLIAVIFVKLQKKKQ